MRPLFTTAVFPVALLALCISLSCHTGDNRKNTPKDALISKLRPLVEIVARDQPGKDAVLKLIGGRVAEQTARYAVVEGDGYKAVLILAPGDPTMLSEVNLHPEFNLGVVFQDITALLGAGETIVESKTSIVVFDCNKIGIHAGVYVSAHLLAPPKYPQSPVQILKIRRGAVPRSDRTHR